MTQTIHLPTTTEDQLSINARFTQEDYAALERKLQQPHVGDKTTPQQAGYQLGIQYVLKVIRDDYVIGSR